MESLQTLLDEVRLIVNRNRTGGEAETRRTVQYLQCARPSYE